MWRSLVFLGVTALLFSRALFFFFNDPEGPNLLIVVVLAVCIWSISAAVHRHLPISNRVKRFGIAIGVQMLTICILYVLSFL